jgi:hypothetical protein
MKSSTTGDFWQCYRALSPAVRTAARKAYKLWLQNPRHGSLQFQKKNTTGVRASDRAIARWGANMKEPCIGSGSGRTTNMNGCWAKDENSLHRQPRDSGPDDGDGFHSESSRSLLPMLQTEQSVCRLS